MEAKFFRALGDETRLTILRHLQKHEICACKFADLTKKDQTTVSRHLKVLAESGIVAFEKQGRKIIYKIKDEKTRKLLKLLT